MKYLVKTLSFVVALVLVTSSLVCVVNAETETKASVPNPRIKSGDKILFVGNSMTEYSQQDVGSVFQQLCASKGIMIETKRKVTGMATMKMQYDNPGIIDLIKQGDWDYVVYQGLSNEPLTDSASFQKYTELLHNTIKEAGKQSILFITWSYRDYAFKADRTMIDTVAKNYKEASERLGIPLAPNGEAWWKITEDRDRIEDLYVDNRHPSTKAHYLNACIFYAFFTGRTPVGITFTNGMSQEEAKFYQQVAWDVVSKGALPEPEPEGMDVNQALKDATVLFVGNADAYIKGEKKKVDSSNLDVKPIVEEGRTLVPVRFIAESLGAEVGFDSQSQTISVKKDDKAIKLTLGSKKIDVNGKESELEVPAKIINDRTLIPLRALVEALDKDVLWDNRGLILIANQDHANQINKDKKLIDDIVLLFTIQTSASPTPTPIPKLATSSEDSLVIVGSKVNFETPERPATLSYDNNLNTSWKTDGTKETAWIEYDLSTSKNVKGLRLIIASSEQRTAPLIIEVGDGQNYKKVWAGNTAYTSEMETIKFDASAIGRYVKITMSDKSSSDNYWFGIGEIDILGE